MYVRWAGRHVDAGVGEEICEAGGWELTGVVRMKSSDEAARLGGTLVHECCERSNELAHVMRGFGFAAHWVSGLKSGMVVH
eukprot:3702321-Pleurochrysis_carterae.AAC.5